MKTFLTGICCLVLAVMLYVTVSASLHQDIVSATRQLWPDHWFRATMAGYLLVQVRSWQPAEGVDALLRGRHAGNRS